MSPKISFPKAALIAFIIWLMYGAISGLFFESSLDYQVLDQHGLKYLGFVVGGLILLAGAASIFALITNKKWGSKVIYVLLAIEIGLFILNGAFIIADIDNFAKLYPHSGILKSLQARGRGEEMLLPALAIIMTVCTIINIFVGLYVRDNKDKLFDSKYVEPEIKNLQDYNKIRGWLLLFIIIMIVISPALNIYQLYNYYYSIPDHNPVYIYLDMGLGISHISLLCMGGFFLLFKRSYAVKLLKVLLVFGFVSTFLVSVILKDFTQLNSAIFGFALWTIFLYKSKRVKAIYGDLKEKTQGIQIWPVLAIIYSIISPFHGIVLAIIALRNIYQNRKLKGLTLSIISLIASVTMLFSLIIFDTTRTVITEKLTEENDKYMHGYLEDTCYDWCYEAPEAEAYNFYYDENDYLMCECVNDKEEIIQKIHL